MCVARGEHASRDQIPAPSHTGGAGLPVRRLARVLVGRLGQTPHVLHRDGGQSEKLSRNAREKITIRAARRTSWASWFLMVLGGGICPVECSRIRSESGALFRCIPRGNTRAGRRTPGLHLGHFPPRWQTFALSIRNCSQKLFDRGSWTWQNGF